MLFLRREMTLLLSGFTARATATSLAAVTRTSTSRLKMSSSTEEVLFETPSAKVGLATLNRPKALNSLNLNMARMLDSELRRWRDEGRVAVLAAAGEKAFCAGGDIRAVTETRGSQLQKDFFKEEYYLNHLIGTYTPCFVALIDGIVMGGGVGLSVHGRYRVATEKTLFAMPETAIGLFPDVGGGYFLPRLRKKGFGTFLALTGERLKGEDCLHAGVATHMCKREQLADLRKELMLVESEKDVEDVLRKYDSDFKKSDFRLESKLSIVADAFTAETVEDVVTKLDAEGSEWAKQQADKIRQMSPTSLKVTMRQMREGGQMSSLADVLAMEYRLARRCCEDNDFYEGVRAILVDKDSAPKWNPGDLQGVTEEKVDWYFSKLPESDEMKFSN